MPNAQSNPPPAKSASRFIGGKGFSPALPRRDSNPNTSIS